MKKLIFYSVVITALVACNTKRNTTTPLVNFEQDKEAIHTFMDAWHLAATNANYENYFSKLDTTSIFIGTDASENWSKEAFARFSKPYFDKGKAWDFKTLDRNVYFNEDGSVAWFDELLSTWMGTCRGSGVLTNTKNGWILKHYVLSVAIPNEAIKEVITVKRKKDSIFQSSFY